MTADEFDECLSEQREERLEFLEDRRRHEVGMDEDAMAAREVLVGKSEAQRALDEGWPTGAEAPIMTSDTARAYTGDLAR